MKNHFCFVDGFLVSLHSRRKHSFSFLFMLRFWSYSQGSLPNPLCRALVFSNVYLDLDAVIQFFSGQRSASLFIYFSSLKDFSFESNCSYPDSSCTHISSEFRNSDTFIYASFLWGFLLILHFVSSLFCSLLIWRAGNTRLHSCSLLDHGLVPKSSSPV